MAKKRSKASSRQKKSCFTNKAGKRQCQCRGKKGAPKVSVNGAMRGRKRRGAGGLFRRCGG